MQTLPSANEEKKPDADDLLVFVDETGHETFAGNQGFYGLGACAVLGAASPLRLFSRFTARHASPMSYWGTAENSCDPVCDPE
jgi:hypothetical protein